MLYRLEELQKYLENEKKRGAHTSKIRYSTCNYPYIKVKNWKYLVATVYNIMNSS